MKAAAARKPKAEPAIDRQTALGRLLLGGLWLRRSRDDVDAIEQILGESALAPLHRAIFKRTVDAIRREASLDAEDLLADCRDAELPSMSLEYGLCVDAGCDNSPDPVAVAQQLAEIDEPTKFEPTADGYRFEFHPLATTFEILRLRRDDHALKCELVVHCKLAGARVSAGDELLAGDTNLSSTQTRRGLAARLAERSLTDQQLWDDAVEALAQCIIAAERAGAPAVKLADLPRPTADEQLEIDGFPLLARHPMTLFGHGGTGKSLLGLYFAGVLATRGWSVVLFDWELDGSDHRDRLEKLFGSAMPDIFYVRCERPFVYEGERLRKVVREQGIRYAVFDSVSQAGEAPLEGSESCNRYYQTLRTLGPIGSLHVAHQSKAEQGDQHPFGSVMWTNDPRSTWNLKAESSPEEHRLRVAAYHRKANLGARRPPIGFEITFFPERTRIRRTEVGSVPELAAHMSIRDRMKAVLRGGALSPEELAEEIDAKADTVRRTVRRYKRQFAVLEGGRVGLLDR